MLYSIVALLVVILDQAVKYWVTNTLMGYDIVKFIPGVISLVNVPNDGAAFSLLSGGGARIYFIIVTVVFCVAVILALATNFISGRVARWSLVMVAAGGFANCIPALRQWLDYPHIASIACPKPMLFINGTRDHLFPVDGTHSAFSAMHDVWRSQNVDSALETELWDVPHSCGKALQQRALEFFNKRFGK